MSRRTCLTFSIPLLIASPLMSDPALGQREISTSIEEVVVTAQKREENLSDVPMAVSALDGKALDRTIARDLQDIQDMSPNIMIDPILGNGTISFMSRGINMDDVEQSFDPAVGVVIDGLHLGTQLGDPLRPARL